MRSGNSISKRGAAVLDDSLDAPEQDYVSSPRSRTRRRSSPDPEPDLRPDYDETGPLFDSEEPIRARQRRSTSARSGFKVKLRTGIPQSLAGRIATGVVMLGLLGCGLWLLSITRDFLLHDSRFFLQSPASIEIQGNVHLTRDELLAIFGDDVGRNIFRVSLDRRKAELEQLPWVQRAIVMRLLPNRLRVAVTERTPVAFVRQGSQISLVDANGVLLDMATPGRKEPHYSFPVVTGISASQPISTRAARVALLQKFLSDLDSTGDKVSSTLGEVDLSDPEDIRALIPDQSHAILVHFGDSHFLERYRSFRQHLPAWHTQYPNLASADMRYDRQVVLDMAPPDAPATPDDKSATPGSTLAANTAPAKATKKDARPERSAHKTAEKPTHRTPSVAHPVHPAHPSRPHAREVRHTRVKPHSHTASPRQTYGAPAPGKPWHQPSPASSGHAQNTTPAGVAAISAAARAHYLGKPAPGTPLGPSNSSTSGAAQ